MKKLLNTNFSFCGDFQQYIRKYLGRVDSQNDDRYNLLAHKNWKYLFYSYNNFQTMKNIESLTIGHSKISDTFTCLVEVQDRDRLYLISVIIARTKNLNIMNEITEKELKPLKEYAEEFTIRCIKQSLKTFKRTLEAQNFISQKNLLKI